MKIEYVTSGEYDKMNPEIKVKWLEALRSGNYQQTRGRLIRTEPQELNESGSSPLPVGYCCLGVLCEVGVADGVVEKAMYDDMPGFRHVKDDGRYWVDTMPSTAISKWAGLESDAESELAGMNDEKGKSFAEIADWIEENL